MRPRACVCPGIMIEIINLIFNFIYKCEKHSNRHHFAILGAHYSSVCPRSWEWYVVAWFICDQHYGERSNAESDVCVRERERGMQISLMYLLLTQSEGNIDHRRPSCPSRFASMSERMVWCLCVICVRLQCTHAPFLLDDSVVFSLEKNQQIATQKLSRSSNRH